MSDEPVRTDMKGTIKLLLIAVAIFVMAFLLVKYLEEPKQTQITGNIDSTSAPIVKLPDGALPINPNFCSGSYLVFITIDSCEYALLKINNSIGLTHKANCRNHKK